MKILIVIPAYNEEGTIVSVVTDLRLNHYSDILVIDDGSTDNTKKLALDTGVTVVHHTVNRGLGAALGTGFEYARRKGIDILVTFDADGQHQASLIARLVKPIQADQADVVIGTRIEDYQKMPFVRRLLNHLANLITFILFFVWTTDSQSGLRAFNKKAINCIKIKTNRMEVSSEFFKEIRDGGLRFAEVPVPAIYTKSSLKSSKQGAWASARITLKLILRLFR